MGGSRPAGGAAAPSRRLGYPPRGRASPQSSAARPGTRSLRARRLRRRPEDAARPAPPLLLASRARSACGPRPGIPPASERTAPAAGSLPAVGGPRGPAACGLGALLAGHGEGGGRLGMGGTAARRGAGVLRALLLALVAAGTPAGAYNLDSQRPVRFQGPAGSFFGYAVLEHFHDNTRW